jgi:hypothetical protein
MEMFTDQAMGDLLAKSLDTAKLGDAAWRDVGKGRGSVDGKFINGTRSATSLEAGSRTLCASATIR